MGTMLRNAAAAATAALALALAGCSGDDDDSPRYSRLVSFGDSLSDVGSYRVGTIAAVGGGEYSVNAPGGGVNWTERLAARVGAPAPCAAQTGLNSEIAGIPPVAVTNVAGCYGYAQGGARVTNPVGVENAALPGAQLGQLTDPVVNQIRRHLAAVGGKFGSDALVTVLAGGNDVFVNIAAVAGGAMTPAQAVAAMAAAGGELAAAVKTQIVANGATHVVVVNLPDVSRTPFGISSGATTQGLINQMVVAFNDQLAAGLAGVDPAVVLKVDAYTRGRDWTSNPARYQLTNVTSPACDFTKTLFASSLVCSASTLIAGDVSRYEFADTVHLTPYGYQLLTDLVVEGLVAQGWL